MLKHRASVLGLGVYVESRGLVIGVDILAPAGLQILYLWLEMIDYFKKEEYKFDWLSNEEYAAIYKTIDLFMIKIPERQPNNLLNEPYNFDPMWRNVIRDHQIDHEYIYTYDSWESAFDNDVWENGAEEATRAYKNGLIWIDNAKYEFFQKIKIFYSILADESVYLKHFSNPAWDRKRVISTSHERSLLLPNISLDLLDKIFTEIVLRYYKQIFTQGYTMIIVRTSSLIGYSKGKECKQLLYKLDFTSFVYHIYPINDDEINNYKLKSIEEQEELIKGVYETKEVEIDNILFTTLY